MVAQKIEKRGCTPDGGDCGLHESVCFWSSLINYDWGVGKHGKFLWDYTLKINNYPMGESDPHAYSNC